MTVIGCLHDQVDGSIESVAACLLAKHRGKAIPVLHLLTRALSDFSSRDLELALGHLEMSGDVYIERAPRVQEDTVVGQGIRSTDIVFFDTFPTILRKSLLYKTGVEYGDFTINHVLGCAHGCRYPCYAMVLAKRYGRVKDYDDWKHPRIVGNALELLEREIPKYRRRIRSVHLSFTTDPFMYDAVNKRVFPWVKDLSLRIIARLNREDIRVTTLTKGLCPFELTHEVYSRDNEYGISLVSLDSWFHGKYEPFSAPPEKRVLALRRLHDAGLKTWVSIEPYPTPNIIEQDLEFLLEKIAFVDKMIFGRWNYNGLADSYQGVTEFYVMCSDMVVQFCREHGITCYIKKRTPQSSKTTRSIFSVQ